jgi:hypothetical protein
MENVLKPTIDRKEYQREYYRTRYNTDPEFKQRHIDNLKKSREKYKLIKKNDINN